MASITCDLTSPSGRIGFVKTLALTGGEVVQSAIPTDRVVAKEGRGNFVTAADEASEKAILWLIAQTFPDDEILTEESRPAVGDLSAAQHLWVIDPLDGTNNFGFERWYAAVSVGYVEGGQLRAGAVYDPFRKELFFAEKGGGRSSMESQSVSAGTSTCRPLRSQPITATSLPGLEAILSCSFGYVRARGS